MRALIRHEGEVVRETDGIEGIDWETGAPLTGPDWCGGAYRLVDDSEWEAVSIPTPYPESPTEDPQPEPESEKPRTFLVNGKELTREELLILLG